MLVGNWAFVRVGILRGVEMLFARHFRSRWAIGFALLTIALHETGAQSATRSISRRQLPNVLQAKLDSGKLSRVSATRPSEAISASQAVVVRKDEVLAASSGTTPVFTRVVPSRSTSSAVQGRNPTGVDSVFTLPFAYVGFDLAGNTPAYHPTLTSMGGLRYSARERTFVGRFAVGLELTDAPGELRELQNAVSMNFGGDADSISPSTIAFKRTGGPEMTVSVYRSVPQDSLRVLIIPKFDPRNPATLWLAVRPTITFQTPPAKMQGFGVESRTLKIGTRGMRLSDSIDVAVSSSAGSLNEDQLRIGSGGGSIKLRSSGGLETAEIRATSAGFEDAEANVEFMFPWLFLAASLLGGTLGALWAELRQRRRGTVSSAARRFFGALIGAVLATIIYVGLGLSLLPAAVNAPLVNEIGVFAFSALGGMYGLKTFSKSQAR